MSQKKIFICVAKDSYEIVPQIEKFYETPTNTSYFSLWSASNHKNLSGSTDYEKEIKKQLKNSDGAILLISKGSLKKDGFIKTIEAPEIIKKKNKDPNYGLAVLVVDDCNFQSDELFGKLQLINSPSTALNNTSLKEKENHLIRIFHELSDQMLDEEVGSIKQQEEKGIFFEERKLYSDDLNSFTEVDNFDTWYVPGGVSLRSNLIEYGENNKNFFKDSSYKRVFSQYCLGVPKNFQKKSFLNEEKALLISLKKIMQRGDASPLDPEIEKELLKHHGYEPNKNILPGDLSPEFNTPEFKLKEEDTFRYFKENKSELRIDDEGWEGPQYAFDSDAELSFYQYIKNQNDESIKWLHPQVSRKLLSKPGTAEGREGVDFLYSPPWGDPVIIEILGEQHFDTAKGEDPSFPETSSSFNKDKKNSLFEVIGIPAKEAKAKKGENWNKAIEKMKLPHNFADDKLSHFLEDIWSIGAVHSCIYELFQSEKFYGKKVWKIMIEGNKNGLIGVNRLLNLIASLAVLWGAEGILPNKVIFLDNKYKILKSFEKNFGEKEYYSKTSIKEPQKNIDIILEIDPKSSYLEEFKSGNKDKIIVKKVSLPFLLRDERQQTMRKIEGIKKNENMNLALKIILQYIFAKEDFREAQLEAIKKSLSGDSSLVLLPTGAGKSLIYQISSIILPAPVLVIDPTVQLINNQKVNLNDNGIDRVIGISQEAAPTPELRELFMNSISIGDNYIILCAPERLLTPRFNQALSSVIRKTGISLVVIDEAHCISEWGQEFRTSYLSIGDRLQKLIDSYGTSKQNERIPLLAMTGTASIAVRDDILVECGLKEDQELRAQNFNRLELEFDVQFNDDPSQSMSRLIDIVEHGIPETANTSALKFYKYQDREIENNLVIIFVHTKPKLLEVYESLENLESLQNAKFGMVWGSGPFDKEGEHRWDEGKFGDSQKYKKECVEQFKKGEVNIIVATKAFGMGIDIPNVRAVLHYGVSSSVEAWYQESGRAGRDGQFALCSTIFTEMDKDSTQDYFSGSYQELLKKHEEKPKVSYKDRDDIDSHLYFYFNSWKGLLNELITLCNVLNRFNESLEFERNQWVNIDFKEGTDFGDGDETKAIYRLLTMGVFEDWQMDYTNKSYKLRTSRKENVLEFDELSKWMNKRLPSSTKGFIEIIKNIGTRVHELNREEIINEFIDKLGKDNNEIHKEDELNEFNFTFTDIKDFSSVKKEGKKIKKASEAQISFIKDLLKKEKIPEEYKIYLESPYLDSKSASEFITFLKYYNKPNNFEASEKQIKLIKNNITKLSNSEHIGSYESKMEKGITSNEASLIIEHTFSEINSLKPEEDLDEAKNYFARMSAFDTFIVCVYMYLVHVTYESIGYSRRQKHLQVYEMAREKRNNEEIQEAFDNYFSDSDSEFANQMRTQLMKNGDDVDLWIDTITEYPSGENVRYELEKIREQSDQFEGWHWSMIYTLLSEEDYGDRLTTQYSLLKEYYSNKNLDTVVLFVKLEEFILEHFRNSITTLSSVYNLIYDEHKSEGRNYEGELGNLIRDNFQTIDDAENEIVLVALMNSLMSDMRKVRV